MPLFDAATVRDLVPVWFRECAPKILVVTDGLNFSPTDDFGLMAFVQTLRGSSIHGMQPTVITAQYDPSAGQPAFDANAKHISNFKFTDGNLGLATSRYDVVFLLGINGEAGPKLTEEAGALAAVTAFMQAGGGLFATGDHEDLGAALSMDIPRVRKMRKWRMADNPPAFSGEGRFTTNLAGADDIYDFNDQADQFPQRLSANYLTVAGGPGQPHPLLQIPGTPRGVEVFPDHPHEGECILPSDYTTKFQDNVTAEWPDGPNGAGPVKPEIVALTMSAGRGFAESIVGPKSSVAPTAFIAICAYDGQLANVGRVVTDATWHHFVNVNINPDQQTPKLGGRDLTDIKQYYVNIATWLMPKQVRSCRRFPWLLQELVRYPLYEEVLPFTSRQLDAAGLRDVGDTIREALLRRHTRAEVNALLEDALEDAVGVEGRFRLAALESEAGVSTTNEAGLAALASLTIATAQRFAETRNQKGQSGEEVFLEVGRQAAETGAKTFIAHQRKQLTNLTTALKAVI